MKLCPQFTRKPVWAPVGGILALAFVAAVLFVVQPSQSLYERTAGTGAAQQGDRTPRQTLTSRIQRNREGEEHEMQEQDIAEPPADLDEDRTTIAIDTTATTTTTLPQHRRDALRGPLNVLIIAEGNTGSEFLLHLLSVVKDGISVFEPFRNFKYDGKVLPGQYGGLYNCSFAVDGGLLSQVVWPGKARDYLLPAFTEATDEFRARVLSTRTAFSADDAEAIHRKCLSSKVKFVSTIRFTGYVRLIPDSVRDRLRVIHLLRHPGAVVADLSRSGSPDNASTTHQLVKELCTRVDGGIQMLLKQQRDRPLFLRSEDLFKAPTALLRIALDFIGVEVTAEMQQQAQVLAHAWAMSNESTQQSDISTSHLSWPKDVAESCSRTLRFGGYL